MQLPGAHALVTGGSRGIGLATARELVRRGARVSLVARESSDLRAAVVELGGTAYPLDLVDRAAVRGLGERVEAESGPVDVLVNAAGASGLGALSRDLPAEELARTFEVNLVAPAELCRQLTPGMAARRRGHVVQISSGFANVTAPGATAYCGSKAGLSHLSSALRDELRGTGVQVTTVEPGPVDTEMLDDFLAHPQTGAAMRRLIRLRMTPVVPTEQLAVAIADAVAGGERYVRLARRLAPVSALVEAPRRTTQLLLSGIRRR